MQAQLYQNQMQQQLYMQQMNQFRPQGGIPSNLYSHYHQLQQAQAMQAGQNPGQPFITNQNHYIMQMNPMFAQNPRHPLPPGAAIGLARPGTTAVAVPGVTPARPTRQPSVHGGQASSNAPTPQPNPSTPQNRPNLPPTPQTAPGSSSIPIRPNPNASLPPNINGTPGPQMMPGATAMPVQQFQTSLPTAAANANIPQVSTPSITRPTHIALPPNNLNIRPNQPIATVPVDTKANTSNVHHLTQEAIKIVEQFVGFFRGNPQSKTIDYWSNLFKKYFVADARLLIQLKNNGSQQSQDAPKLGKLSL
ncbi:hypothetical protein CONCODRAFT_105842 [Conidiobolus coronatus NRRL 28638]|uniref:Uncharacterized protein n=1 Tax=Conidiobolus coronatus (strain ATCC 28846 / CBS 209.66 / NRRL 28638) TaxID=796925 RepID=A0A137NZV3_CONC2|nr:hypothetical protein CONCODRAFT_105842 [Conidiobolus coronatus NRRL 28638]|eukprot:KXN68335.1 hypothetical protein CONCODRAFT_105842 [Conidiobolus coronatus NRRL 28638]